MSEQQQQVGVEHQQRPKAIVVIGLGFAGASVLAHLCLTRRSELASGHLRVTALERDPVLYGG